MPCLKSNDMSKLTEEQKAYIKEHKTESPTAMARKIGCAIHTIYYYLKLYGCNDVIADRKAYREHIRNEIKRLYPDHSATEIASMLGLTRNSISKIAYHYGLKHTLETQERLRLKSIQIARSPEFQKIRADGLRRTLRMERIRLKNGLPQKTKRKFRMVSRKALSARNYLTSAYNYFYDKELGEMLTIFYDSSTKRLPPDKEQHYKDVYHIKFEQADE